MYELIGANVLSWGGPWTEKIKRWKPPIILSQDHADVVHDIRTASPESIIVGRLMGPQQDMQPDFHDPGLDPYALAAKHVATVMPWVERMTGAYDYWQAIINEPVITTPEAAARFGLYCIEIMDLADQAGFKVVIGVFSVGTPEFDIWSYMIPTLRCAKKLRMPLALHEYQYPLLSTESDWPWYLLRHETVWNGSQETVAKWGWHGLPEDLHDTALVILESGVDALISEPAPCGWRCAMDHAGYLSELEVYNQQLLKTPYVLGSAVFAVCDPNDADWGTYSIAGEVLDHLADHAAPLYREWPNSLPIATPCICRDQMPQIGASLDRIITTLEAKT